MSSALRPPLAVLGMHRSGTSCLAGSLQEAGLYLGNVNTKAPANARGNRENRALMDFHDEVLSAAGYSWDRPPAKPLPWSSTDDQAVIDLLASYPADQRWGFKDPRSLLFWPQWTRVLPELEFVASLRHPASVAASLRRRNKFSWTQGYQLWTAYNAQLLAMLKAGITVPLISFDQPAQQYRTALSAVIQRLQLQTPVNGFQFFSGKLRNALPDDYPPLPDEVDQLYQELLDHAH